MPETDTKTVADSPRKNAEGDLPRIACPSFPKLSRRTKKAPVSLAGAGVDVRFAEVDNPYFQRGYAESAANPRTVQAARNSNESPLVRLEALGSIDAIQAAAGHKFRALYEKLMAGQASPSDIKEHVDGSSAPDIFTEGRQMASFKLRKASQELLPVHYYILRFVCGEGRALSEFDASRQLRKGTGKIMLLTALDRLSEIWHLKPTHANRNHAPPR